MNQTTMQTNAFQCKRMNLPCKGMTFLVKDGFSEIVHPKIIDCMRIKKIMITT